MIEVYLPEDFTGIEVTDGETHRPLFPDELKQIAQKANEKIRAVRVYSASGDLWTGLRDCGDSYTGLLIFKKGIDSGEHRTSDAGVVCTGEDERRSEENRGNSHPGLCPGGTYTSGTDKDPG